MSEIEIIQPATKESRPQKLSDQSFFKKWGGLFVLSLGLAIVIIDTTLLNVSLGNIIKDLHTDLQSIQWVITAYALVLAAFTITGGRFGDLFGRKRMFMLGAIIFAVGSFIASISHSIPVLLLGESIIEGFGAALMMPATASLVVANFQGSDRSKAFGVWGAVAGASSALGPLLGGYLTSHYSWRWGFRINLVIAVLVIIGSILLIKESRDERKPKLDFGGVALSSLGLLSLVFGIIESSSYGWWKAKTAFILGHYSWDLWGYSIVPFAIALGVILLAAFFWWENVREKKGQSVLVSFHLFQNRQYTVGTMATMLLTLAMTGQLFALPIFLQSVMGLDAFHTGLAMLPLPATLLVIAPLAGILSKRVQPRYLIWTGLAIATIAPFIVAASLKPGMHISHLIPGLMLYGFGMGLMFPPLSDITLSAVPVEMAGEASGVNNTFRQIGATLGAAIIGAAVLTSLGLALTKGINASPVVPSQYKQQIATQLSNPNANVEFGGANNLSAQLSPNVAQEIQTLAKEATTEANKDAYVFAALFAFLGLIVALFLPKTSSEHHVEGQSVILEEKPVGGRRYAFAIILIITGLTSALYILHYRSGKTIATGSLAMTVDDIRNAFVPQGEIGINTPENSQSYRSTTTAESQLTASVSSQSQLAFAPQTQPQNQTSNQSKGFAKNVNPRGTEPGGSKVLGATTVIYAPPVEQTYRNDSLGFQVTVNNNWQAQQVTNNQVALVSSSGRQDTIEMYNNVGMDLDGIENQLRGSNSVSKVYRTMFGGEGAVGFITTSGQQGVAVIHNNKLYYIMASSLNSEPLSTFAFI